MMAIAAILLVAFVLGLGFSISLSQSALALLSLLWLWRRRESEIRRTAPWPLWQPVLAFSPGEPATGSQLGAGECEHRRVERSPAGRRHTTSRPMPCQSRGSFRKRT